MSLITACVMALVCQTGGATAGATDTVPPDKLLLSLTLGLEPEDIGFGMHQPSVYSAGVTFYLVPVKSPATACVSIPTTP